MAFDYKFPLPPTDPNCKSQFTRSFQHRDWVDGQDVVQAESAEDGFNARFHKIEHDLDALNANLANAFACIEILRGQLVQALADIKNQFNAKPPKEGKDSKEFKDVKDAKDGKDSKDGKDVKDTKDGKDSKDSKDVKDTKDTKDTKDSKDHKDGKEDKDGKEGFGAAEKIFGAAEKQLDRLETPALSALSQFLWSSPVNLGAESSGVKLGRAFIRPEERPEVGARAIERAGELDAQVVQDQLRDAMRRVPALREELRQIAAELTPNESEAEPAAGEDV